MSWKKIFPFIVLLIAALLLGCAAEQEPEKVKTIQVGVLVDLSGPLSTYGNDIKNTLEIAKEDINKYFEEKGLPYKVEFYYEDTRVDPDTCLKKIQALYGRGIRLIIGPMGSGEVQNIRNFVTSNKIIIISPSSTALPKNIGCTKPEEKKYIFRFVGIDDLQSKAIADELKDLGIKGVVITYIGNAWGRGLYECIKPQLEEAGIEIAKIVEYPDKTPADFSPYIAELENGISELLNKYNATQVAVIAFSYEEVYTMIAQTDANSDLFKVIWFGCDGCAKSGRIDEVCDKVTKIGMYSTLFEAKGPAYEELKKKYQGRGYGDSPYQYALNAYDAALVLCLAYAELMKEKGSYDADVMVEKIREATKKYSEGEYGVQPVSGYIELNEWNDRATGDYAIWYVNNECKWDKAGIWYYSNETITWFHKPTPPE